MRLVFLGLPGAGKGTQAKRVSRELSIPHLSVGHILRAAVKAETEMGQKARPYMEAGELVPDEFIVPLVAEYLDNPDCAEGYLLDGFPRTLAQAEALESEAGGGPERVIFLAVPREDLFARLTGRRICRACGDEYHLDYLPPKVEGACDQCQGELYQREDDTAETVENRLQVNEKTTKELQAFYGERGVLEEVDAAGDVEGISKAILEVLRG